MNTPFEPNLLISEEPNTTRALSRLAHAIGFNVYVPCARTVSSIISNLDAIEVHALIVSTNINKQEYINPAVVQNIRGRIHAEIQARFALIVNASPSRVAVNIAEHYEQMDVSATTFFKEPMQSSPQDVKNLLLKVWKDWNPHAEDVDVWTPDNLSLD